MDAPVKKFGEILLEKAMITQAQLAEAIHKQETTMSHRKIGAIFIRMGALAMEHVKEILTIQGKKITPEEQCQKELRVMRDDDGYITSISSSVVDVLSIELPKVDFNELMADCDLEVIENRRSGIYKDGKLSGNPDDFFPTQDIGDILDEFTKNPGE